MPLKLANRLFPRSFMRYFLLTSPESSGIPLTPYFQYKIGAYQKDYFLYFRKEPKWVRYKGEAFDKLCALRGYDIPRFLDFHYDAYPDKADFRRFFRYELTPRLAYVEKHPKYDEPGYHIALKWLNEKEALEAVKTSAVPVMNGDELLGETVSHYLGEISRSYAGNIVLHDSRQLERLIQLLIVVKDLRSPGKNGEALFAGFSTTDLAAVLRQIVELREYKVNTIQKKIAECNQRMFRDERVAALNEALSRFFFGE